MYDSSYFLDLATNRQSIQTRCVSAMGNYGGRGRYFENAPPNSMSQMKMRARYPWNILHGFAV